MCDATTMNETSCRIVFAWFACFACLRRHSLTKTSIKMFGSMLGKSVCVSEYAKVQKLCIHSVLPSFTINDTDDDDHLC